ncbi:hypothetical protein [Pseudarthrobacter polychromogenes]|nr:hypothetical protein [Pseudarthrobacter polychromogenes]
MKFTAIVVIAPDDLEDRIIEHAQGPALRGSPFFRARELVVKPGRRSSA